MSRKRDGVKSKRVMPGVSLRGRMFKKEPAQSTKIARNAPCPCGSGKKYKNCCYRSPRGVWAKIKRWLSGKES